MRRTCRLTSRSTGPLAGGAGAPSARRRLAWFVRRPRATLASIATSVLGWIGNTPLVRLRHIVPRGAARVVAKLEWANTTGSMKDRMANAAVTRAELDGRLRPGGTVVEYTAGTTGVSLGLVCAAEGYGLEIVLLEEVVEETPQTIDAFSA